MSSLIFADHTRLTAAAAKLVRAQAEFDAVVTKCNAIMLPLHTALEEANDEFKKAASQCAADEAAYIEVDLEERYVAVVTPAIPPAPEAPTAE